MVGSLESRRAACMAVPDLIPEPIRIRMRVVHTVATLHPDAGGPSRTVSKTCAGLARQGLDVSLVTTDAGGREAAMVPGDEAETRFVPSDPFWRRPGRFRNAVAQEARGADLVHDHGVWLLTNRASALAARDAGCPLVLTTRGMLEPWALSHHGWKKTVAWHLYQQRILRQAALLHATSDMEADNLRALDLDAPIAVIPNGVPLPRSWKNGASGDGAADAPRRALFLSRVHPKKGLLPLIDAWANVRPAEWELVIAGPSEGGHRAEVEERVDEHGLGDAVRFTGPIPDADKWDLYRASDLFVLPTFSENFGVVVAEALASGIPAITTTGAPWHELDTHDCGWWIDPGAAPLADALADATSRSDDDRCAMGRRGRALVEDQYSWDHVATQMAKAYRWLLDDAPRPDTIQME